MFKVLLLLSWLYFYVLRHLLPILVVQLKSPSRARLNMNHQYDVEQ